MLRQVAVESGIVLVLTTLLVGLAATAGLPGRPDTPARAAEDSLPVSVGARGGGEYRAVPTGIHPRLFDGMSGHIGDVR